MECIIHCTSTEGQLSKLSGYESWLTLLEAAKHRNFEPILEASRLLVDHEIPNIWYHRSCRSVFTLKKNLDKFVQDDNGETLTRKSQRNVISNSSGTVLPKTCLFCQKEKYLCKTRTREKLVLCTDLRVDTSLKEASKAKQDTRIMAICSEELVAKEAWYHRTCYREYNRVTYVYQESEGETMSGDSKEIEAVKHRLSDLIKNPDVVEYIILTDIVEKTLREEGETSATVISSAKKNLKRKIQNEFDGINFITSSGRILIYPDTLSKEELVTKSYNLKKELECTLKCTNNEKLVIKCATILREEI